MERLEIEQSEYTPYAILDKINNILELGGRSLPENAIDFFDPIIGWLLQYSKVPNPKTSFNFKMEYFNTPSSKKMLDILTIMEEIRDSGIEVIINWHYDIDDKDMIDAGKEFAELVDLKFEFICNQ
ncbi:MAG: nuclear pore complex subunit [Bacteroidetes bacterium GWA2_31_9]|nr:MAG: nuclear pore complex subunit [Bacteroidetes bacterium GWA2_31_9]